MKNDESKFKNVINLINTDEIGPIFFISPNPNRGIGLETEIDNYHIICSQKADIVGYLRKEKVSVLCLNSGNIKNSGKILENRQVLRYIKEKSKGERANIMTFKPSPKIAKICGDNSFRYLGNDWRLSSRLENKIEFVKITKKLRIPNGKSGIIKLNKKIFKNSSFNFKENKKFVMQLPRGFSGNSTFLIKNKKNLNKIIKKYLGRKVKFSEYIDGETYTINVCVGKFGTLISQPIFQITGLVAYNKNKLGTSGNDYVYAQKLNGKEKKKIFNYTKKIGDYIGKLGYKGIFGLDFIVSENEVDLIEINSRLIGSIPVFTKLQTAKNQTTFLTLHLLEFLNINYNPGILFDSFGSYAAWAKEKNFSASHLILRNTKKDFVKVAKTLISGIYEFKKNKLVSKKAVYCINRKLGENEVLVQCAPQNSLINPDMEYANIQTSYGIMENKHKFKSYFNKIANLILKNISVNA